MIMATLTLIMYMLLGGRKGNASFLDPMGLQKQLKKLKNKDVRRKALVLMDQINALAKEYDTATNVAIEVYTEDLKHWKPSVTELIEVLESQDQIRAKTLPKLLELRQHLLDTLSPEDWDKVFSQD